MTRQDYVVKDIGLAEWGRREHHEGGVFEARAQSLLNRTPGDEILGYIRANGDVLRCNVRTNGFVVRTAQGQIRTLFRPNDGVQYWLRQVP